ncbi:MAG: D-sedoheptulose 7-phosphate isomerase [Nitrospinae bacterium]|nr:D-sedoheptulose 7-phosphate isomerase [Nitrospinota bacterium]
MERIKKDLLASAELKKVVAETLSGEIYKAAQLIKESLANGGKLLLMGNGGSASDAQHIAAELVGRFKKERKALPAIALTANTSTLTAIGNDYEYASVFSRQVEAFARKGDAVLGISTSGNSENVVRALKRANELGAATIGLFGNEGGKAKDCVQVAIVVPSRDTARIQEAHIAIGHVICEILEQDLTRENKI